ncbi:MAG: hypothetical protein JSW17_03540 [Candidatus Omnitrophota bacterium]|nr:MAG: hypothetical protein JSW17_03540 [Candidatus Omnitrophota bacterium]
MMRLLRIKIILIAIFCIVGAGWVYPGGIEKRFNGKGKLTYKVYFNGLPAGSLEWEYLGKEKLGDKEAEVVGLNSCTKIFKFFNMQGDERVFLDSSTYLPLKVERDIVCFGKRELIEEIYNQDEGYVEVSNSRLKDIKCFRQDKPIHNILALLYFFPEGVKLEKGKQIYFNLPTRTVKVKVASERMLSTRRGKRPVYLLVGRGGKRFNLWLDKEERLPLRVDFLLPLGKISIVKRD